MNPLAVAGARPSVPALRAQWGRDALLRNSVWLMANMVMLAGLGFVFWALAGRALPAGPVGMVTTSMSTLTLLQTAGALGLPVALVPTLARHSDRSRAILLLSLALSSGFTAIVTLVALATPLRPPFAANGVLAALVVLALAVSGTFGAVQDAAFLAARKAHLLLVKNSVSGVGKILLLLALSPSGWGERAALYLMLVQLAGTVVPALIAWTMQQHGVVRGPARGAGSLVREMAGFALHNHGAALVSMLPSTLAPLLVLHLLGKDQAAFFNMPMMLLALINVAPNAVAQSLLAAGGAGEDRLANLRRSFLITYAILVPGVLLVVAAAPWLLLVFGQPYTDNATALLRLLAVGALASGVSYIVHSAINSARDGRGYLMLVSFNAALVVGGVAAVAGQGLTAVGLAWLAAQVVSALAAGGYLWSARHRLLAPGEATPRAEEHP